MNYIKAIFILIIASSFLFSQEIYEGYTLFTPFPEEGSPDEDIITYLIDNELNTINSWANERGPASMPYLLPDSTLFYPYRVSYPSMDAGGTGGGIKHIGWDGTLLWEFIIADYNYQQHHDIQPLPNGNILVIAWERKTAAEAYAMGRQYINNPLYEFWCEAILEIQPIGINEGAVVWEWHLWDHLIQDISTDYPNFGVISDHPELIDINYGDVGTYGGGPGGPNADWMHFNSIDYNEALDQIVLSSRSMNEIYIIDHSTTTTEAAGHSGGNSNMGGDLLYRWGNPEVYQRGNSYDQVLDSQHSANWIPSGYPGGDNLILFNNFQSSWSSAAIELITPMVGDFNYYIEDNEPFGPESPVWTFSEGIFSEVQSGVFRLPNGNTLITDANSLRIIEVTYAGDIVWDYTFSGDGIMIARAQKYSLDYLGSWDDFTLGDVNDDGFIDILDLVGLVSIVLGWSDSVPAADLNDDGTINILDAIVLINLILGNS